MINCSKCEELILEYINNKLESREKEGIDLHLKECNNCFIEFNLRKELLEMLSTINLQPISAGNRFDTEILARYAFNDMSKEEMAKVSKHISTCDYCSSEIANLREAEKEIPDNLIYKPLPASYYYNKYNEKLLGKKHDVTLTHALAASQGNKVEDVPGIYPSIEISQSEDGKINLIDPNNCPEELSRIRWTIDGKEFFYKIFGIYDFGEPRELLSGSDEYLPITIEKPDTDYLFVFISQEKGVLEREKEHLLQIMTGEVEAHTEGIIVISAHIKKDKD